MRKFIPIMLALGVVGLVPALPARADVTVTVPGISINPGPSDYWRNDEAREHEWRRRQAWQEYRNEAWRHNHCVTDWRGEVYCR